MRLRWFLLVLAVSGRLLAAEAVSTEPAPSDAPVPPSEARVAEAKARYEEGVDAYTNGRYKDAVDLFLEADRISPSAPLSFNIARGYEKLGDDSGALRWYRDYLRRSPTAPNKKEVEELVVRFEARLVKKGVRQLTVMSKPHGATLAVDGKPVGVTPWTGDLPAGQHEIALMLRGHEDRSLTVDLGGERSRDVELALVPVKEAAAPPAVAPAAPPPVPITQPPPVTEKSSEGGGLGVWPYVTLGAGGAALGGALVFELLRRSAESDAEADPTQVGYKENLDKMESRRTTARVLAGVGGALVVAGGILLAVDLGSSKGRSTARLGAAPRPGGFEASFSGSF